MDALTPRRTRYEPTSTIETAVSSATFIVEILLIVYPLVTV
jgi:hypothetical protein